MRSLWDVDPAEHLCACGQAIDACVLWHPVLEEALGGATSQIFRNVRKARDSAGRTRDIPPRWVASALGHPGGARSSTRRYGDVLEGIYRSVLKRSSCRVVVDSSKHPSEALLLSQRPTTELYLLHVVRDPRGVAFSWTKSGDRHSATTGATPPRRGAASSSMWWTTWNLVLEGIRPGLADRYRRVRYEDLMSNPRRVFEEIAVWAGADRGGLPFIADDMVNLNGSHLAAGNPSRLRTGHVQLRVDQEWETHQLRGDRVKATVPALPLLTHYKYPLFG
jgi:hypothetical protein